MELKSQKEQKEQKPPTALQRRVTPRRVVLFCLLSLLVLAADVLYSQRTAITSFLFETHMPTGSASVTLPQLPAGFQASVFYQGLKGPRFMAFGPHGTLFIAESSTGNIVALPDAQHTGVASEGKIVISGLNDPTSLDFHQGYLYVGEGDKVTRFTIGADLSATDRRVIAPLPAGGNHITRTVLIGADNHLYVSIGSTCNVCIEQDPQRAAVWVYNLDGSDGHLYAKGLRNAVGMAINPWNKQIWATDNGRDLMGDNIPPETVYALQAGGNYGWPRCHAGDIIDPDYGHPGDCNGVIKPLVKMQAHSAPLGLAFYTANQFPQQYHGLFVAFHGSWNRTQPTGYKVVFIPMNQQGQISGQVQDFATGWLHGADSSGRPAGVIVGPDGALYISDDKAGAIYRITYHK